MSSFSFYTFWLMNKMFTYQHLHNINKNAGRNHSEWIYNWCDTCNYLCFIQVNVTPHTGKALLGWIHIKNILLKSLLQNVPLSLICRQCKFSLHLRYTLNIIQITVPYFRFHYFPIYTYPFFKNFPCFRYWILSHSLSKWFLLLLLVFSIDIKVSKFQLKHICIIIKC